MKKPKASSKTLKLRARPSALLNRISGLLQQPQVVTPTEPSSLSHWRDTYSTVREASYRLNNQRLVPSLSKEAIEFAASSLGMLDGKIIVFGTEDETSVLMDFAVFNHRIDGKNTITRFRESNAGSLTAPESKWLLSAERARYTLLLLGEAIPEAGRYAHDILFDQPIVLMDVNFSRVPAAGLTVATRIIPVDDFYMTGGAALPLTSAEAFRKIEQYIDRTCSGIKGVSNLSPQRLTWLEAFVISTLLDFGASERVRYASP